MSDDCMLLLLNRHNIQYNELKDGNKWIELFHKDNNDYVLINIMMSLSAIVQEYCYDDVMYQESTFN